jgi:uncharacterized protein (UPF0332 family)
LTIEELEADGQIRRITIDKRGIGKALEIARRDLEAAKFNQGNNNDWALNIAHNSILQSLVAFMYSKGYRPAGSSHHLVAIRFAELFFDEMLVRKIDSIRRKRITSTYDQSGTVSDNEAKSAIATAENVLRLVEEKTK